MFERLVALESRLDAELPRPHLRGRPPATLRARAREWSETVWSEAERLGPFTISREQIACGLDLASRPVFVCGVHRSGTTLVRDLLDGHPALTVLPSEGSFYTTHRDHLSASDRSAWRHFTACEWCRRLANPINQLPYWLIGRSTPTYSPSVAFMRAVATWWTTVEHSLWATVTSWPLTAIALAYASYQRESVINPEVRRWVEKTPTNEQFLGDIWRDYPEAKVVHVVRDPLAVMASRKVMEERATGQFGAFRTALGELADSYRIADVERAHANRERYLLIRFEELLEEPQRTTDRLATFLAVANLPILHRPTSGGIFTASNSSFGAGESGTIDRSRARVTMDVLLPEERLRVAVAVGDAAGALGYAVPA
jgi:Sulfotransferase family